MARRLLAVRGGARTFAENIVFGSAISPFGSNSYPAVQWTHLPTKTIEREPAGSS